jgi:hypothetical protein
MATDPAAHAGTRLERDAGPPDPCPKTSPPTTTRATPPSSPGAAITTGYPPEARRGMLEQIGEDAARSVVVEEAGLVFLA